MQHRWIGITGILVAVTLAAVVWAQVPQQPPVPDSLAQAARLQPPPASGTTEITDLRSLWQLTELGGGIRWLIFAVFAIGVFFTTGKMVELTVDKMRARRLERTDWPRLSIQQMEELATTAKPCLVTGLITKILNFYRVAGSEAALHEEIPNFIAQQQERFETFRSRMIFLADTAGALGLLGTVWGMFLTFFGGNLDSQRILNGMGIALITTLMGLVVSIVLNFASTELHGFFNRRLDVTTDLGEALRLELLRRTTQARSRPPVQPARAQRTTAVPSPRQVKLRPLGPLKLSALAGAPLPQPLQVEANLEDGSPFANGELIFEVAEAGGSFNGEKTRYHVRTDQHGRASAAFRLSRGLGTRKVVVSVKEARNSRLEFEIEGVSGPPAGVTILRGNHQSARVKQALKEPLAIQVTDEAGNPVSGVRVLYTLVKGSGRFDKGTSTLETRTNPDGCAEARFAFGDQSGVHEITVFVEGLRGSPLTFEAMAQPKG